MFARKNTRAGTASALLQPPHTLALEVNMTNANATTIIKLLAAIEFSSDNEINSDMAVKLQELAALELSVANSDERFNLSEAINILLDSDEVLSEKEVKYYESFIENYGLL